MNSLKIYHRTNFWGNEIKGRYTQRGLGHKVVNCQVVLENYHKFSGCCQSEGTRVAELKEHHFLAHYTGNWNLFLVERKMSSSSGAYYFTFCLLPETAPAPHFWAWERTFAPHMLRMELATHVASILHTNQPYKYPRNHVHLMVVMDKFVAPPEGTWCRMIESRQARHMQHSCLPNDLVQALDGTALTNEDKSQGRETNKANGMLLTGASNIWMPPPNASSTPNASFNNHSFFTSSLSDLWCPGVVPPKVVSYDDHAAPNDAASWNTPNAKAAIHQPGLAIVKDAGMWDTPHPMSPEPRESADILSPLPSDLKARPPGILSPSRRSSKTTSHKKDKTLSVLRNKGSILLDSPHSPHMMSYTNVDAPSTNTNFDALDETLRPGVVSWEAPLINTPNDIKGEMMVNPPSPVVLNVVDDPDVLDKTVRSGVSWWDSPLKRVERESMSNVDASDGLDLTLRPGASRDTPLKSALKLSISPMTIPTRTPARSSPLKRVERESMANVVASDGLDLTLRSGASRDTSHKSALKLSISPMTIPTRTPARKAVTPRPLPSSNTTRKEKAKKATQRKPRSATKKLPNSSKWDKPLVVNTAIVNKAAAPRDDGSSSLLSDFFTAALKQHHGAPPDDDVSTSDMTVRIANGWSKRE